jgi:pimeloyl-ACP methyl ester carboxylesterase
VLDNAPAILPPGIEATAAALDAADLRRAALASAALLATVSEAAAREHPARLPRAMADYATRELARAGTALSSCRVMTALVRMGHMSERFVVSAGGCDLAGERWAGDAAGPTVVLLHEGVADRRGWHEVARRIAPRATVVAYDRRGHGESPVSTSEFSHDGDLRAVLDEERVERAWLAGASSGGGVALDAAIGNPDRVAGLILIATAVSGAPDPELDETEERFGELFDAAIEAGDAAEINRLDTWFWLDGPYSQEGRVGGAARELALDMNAIIIANDAGDAGEGGVDAWNRLGEVTVPVTVAWGTLDARHIIGRCRELASRLPGASCVELPGVAHQPYLEQPAAVAGLILDAMGLALTPAGA